MNDSFSKSEVDGGGGQGWSPLSVLGYAVPLIARGYVEKGLSMSKSGVGGESFGRVPRSMLPTQV